MSGDIELNPSPNSNLSKCRVLYLNSISELQTASQKYDIVLCFETLVCSLRYVSDVLLSGFNKPTLLQHEFRSRICGLAAYIRSGYSATV